MPVIYIILALPINGY